MSARARHTDLIGTVAYVAGVDEFVITEQSRRYVRGYVTVTHEPIGWTGVGLLTNEHLGDDQS